MLKHNGGFLLFILLETFRSGEEEHRSKPNGCQGVPAHAIFLASTQGTQQPKARNTTKRSNLLQNVVINKNKLLNTIQNC